MLLSKDQKKAIYNLLPPNRWLNREIEYYDGNVSQNICQLGAK